MATTWTKPVSREIEITGAGGGIIVYVVTLDEKGVTLREKHHRKSASVSYVALAAEIGQ